MSDGKTATNVSARSLELLARIIGNKKGIRVIFDSSASTAWTNGKVIALPCISGIGTEDHAVLLEGLLDHEAMHCRFTDFSVKRDNTPVLLSLSNIIEDVWGEREQAKVYPGCFQNIRKSMRVLIEMGMFRGPSRKDTPGALVCNWILTALLTRLYGEQDFLDLGIVAKKYRNKVESVLGKNLTAEIWNAALKVDSVTSTQQGVDLARSIIELFRRVVSEETAGTGTGTGTGAGAGAGAGKKQFLQEVLLGTENQIPSGDLADVFVTALKKEEKMGAPDGLSFSSTDEILPKIETRLLDEGDLDEREAVVGISRTIEIKLGTRLESLLETRVNSETVFKRSGRRLSSCRLPQVSHGQLNIFRSVEEADGIDTSVLILCDFSGSMFSSLPVDGDCFKKTWIAGAVGVSYAASQVLDKFGIPFSFCGFGDNLIRLKAFEQRWGTSRQFFMWPNLNGTKTGDAILAVAPDFLLRPEHRKILVLVTDGIPNNSDNTIVVMNDLRKMGIEFACLFIGIGGKNFQQMLKQDGYQVARAYSTESLAEAFFSAIENAF